MSADFQCHQSRPYARIVAAVRVAGKPPCPNQLTTLVLESLLQRHSNSGTLVVVLEFLVDGSIDPRSGKDLSCLLVSVVAAKVFVVCDCSLSVPSPIPSCVVCLLLSLARLSSLIWAMVDVGAPWQRATGCIARPSCGSTWPSD